MAVVRTRHRRPGRHRGAVDWQINIAGLDVGDTFSLSLQAVPAPATLPLLLAGLGIAGFVGRRRASR